MTGTASDIYEFNDMENSDLSNADLLSAWLFGRINANCTLADLDSQGCTILIPKNQPLPTGTFKLMIMSPENCEHVHTTINAEKQWADDNYSKTHIKIGARFKNLEHYLLMEINLLLSHIMMQHSQNIKCCILQR